MGPFRIATSQATLKLLCLLGLALQSACSGDDAACDDTYWADLVDVTLEPTLTEPGEYLVGLNSAEVSGTCRVVVGSSSLEPCSSARMTVDGMNLDGVVELSQLHVWFDNAPATLTVTVAQDTTSLVTQQFEPLYVTESPNGQSCETRRRASLTLTLSSAN